MDTFPERVRVVPERPGVVKARSETFGGLEAASLCPEATGRPALKILFLGGPVEVGEADGATGKEKIGEGALDGSQERGEFLPLASR